MYKKQILCQQPFSGNFRFLIRKYPKKPTEDINIYANANKITKLLCNNFTENCLTVRFLDFEKYVNTFKASV
jgi:hypothetical protein